MKDLLLSVQVVVKTINLEISVIWQTTSENFTKVRAARVARFIFLIQPIRSLFSGVGFAVSRLCFSSLLE